MIEGPYGAASKSAIRDADTNIAIAIASGIGITSILGHLQD
jgi:predicted ferric reductase